MTDLTKLYDDERKWGKGPGHCIIDQIFHEGLIGGPDPVVLALRKACQEIFPDRVGGPDGIFKVIDFNDHPATTFADVQVVLRRAQEILYDMRKDKP
jgi:hypothetical protein